MLSSNIYKIGMYIRYTWICRQFRLLTWTYLIDKFFLTVEVEECGKGGG